MRAIFSHAKFAAKRFESFFASDHSSPKLGSTSGRRQTWEPLHPKNKSPDLEGSGLLGEGPGGDLLSHGEAPHYHRRYTVSLLSSGRDQVVPVLCGRQEKGLEAAPGMAWRPDGGVIATGAGYERVSSPGVWGEPNGLGVIWSSRTVN